MDKLKFVKNLPFDSVIDGEINHEVALWKSEDSNTCNLCEHIGNGNCDTSGYYYGTEDEREPKFCARHFYQKVVAGNGKNGYALRDHKKPEPKNPEVKNLSDDALVQQKGLLFEFVSNKVTGEGSKGILARLIEIERELTLRENK